MAGMDAPCSSCTAAVPHMIDTGRLRLRPLAPTDDRDVTTIGGSREIADAMITVPHPLTLATARRWIARECAAMRRGTALVCAVERGTDASLLGVVSLRHLDREHACGELSYWLAAHAHGQGYATEAAGALVHHGFVTRHLNRVEAYQMVRNTASQRVLTRLGFRLEGTLRERVIKWGVRENVHLWAKLRADSAP